VDLYEVAAAGSPEQQEFFGESDRALEALEGGNFNEAAQRAGALLMSHRGDGPLLLTLSRATEMLMHGGTFHPVWEPPGK
jgi:hypothetical protein